MDKRDTSSEKVKDSALRDDRRCSVAGSVQEKKDSYRRKFGSLNRMDLVAAGSQSTTKQEGMGARASLRKDPALQDLCNAAESTLIAKSAMATLLEPSHASVTSNSTLMDPLQQHRPPNSSSQVAPPPPSLPGAYPQRGINHHGRANNGGSEHTISLGGTVHGTTSHSYIDLEQPTLRSNSGLAHANPVPQSEEIFLEELEVAEPMDASNKSAHSAQQKETTRRVALILGTLGLLLVVFLVYFLLAWSHSEPKDNKSTEASTSDTAMPTAAPTPELLLSLLPPTTQLIVRLDQDMNTPQSKAYHWLQGDPNIQTYSTDRLLQRFAMATLYYSTGGPNWKHQGGGTMEVLVPLPEPNGRPPRPPPGGGAGGSRPPPLEGGGTPPPNAINIPGKSSMQPVNITSERWLDYNAHECTWFWTSTRGKSMCSEDGNTVEVFAMVANDMAGTLPEELVLLTSLKKLELHTNSIGGTLLTQIGKLSNLQALRLNSNKFHGTVPSEIGLLSNTLQTFAILENDFTGTLPMELWKLSHLTEIKTARNSLSGTLPANIGDLFPTLTQLRIHSNNFAGSLPSTIGQMTTLQQLDLSENAMTGTLATELGLLTRLHQVRLGSNQWTGTLPSQLGLLKGAKVIVLNDNLGLEGSIPVQWGWLNDTLKGLNLKGTSITGTIPSSLCPIKNLEFDCSTSLCGCIACPCA